MKVQTEPSLKLLIVDDQQAVRMGLKKTIEEMGLGITQYLEADSGEAAIAAAQSHRPDIILTDIMMEGMDGLDMVALLRRAIAPETHIVFISAYDKFEFARKAMDLRACKYLLKPVSGAELFQTLTGIISEIFSMRRGAQLKQMREKAYQCMLLYEYLTGKNHRLNLGELFQGAGLTALAYPETFVAVGSPPEESEKPREALDSYRLHGLKAVEGGRYVLVETPEEWLAIGAADEDGAQTVARGVIAACMSACRHVGVSETAAGLSSLPALYRHGCLALENGRLNGEAITFYHQPETPDIGAYRHVMLPVLDGDIGKAGQEVDGLFIHFKRNRMGRADIIKIIHGITSYLCVHMEGLAPALENAGLMEERLYQCDSHIQMKSYMLHVMSVACQIKNKPGGTPSMVYDRIAEYIQTHYGEELSLSGIAEAFDMNYFYLSSMFKQHFQVSYTEYLMKVRLKKAAELLRTTGLMVYEIAQRVGYNDVKYFTRQFKKEYLETPERYRKGLQLSAMERPEQDDGV